MGRTMAGGAYVLFFSPPLLSLVGHDQGFSSGSSLPLEESIDGRRTLLPEPTPYPCTYFIHLWGRVLCIATSENM